MSLSKLKENKNINITSDNIYFKTVDKYIYDLFSSYILLKAHTNNTGIGPTHKEFLQFTQLLMDQFKIEKYKKLNIGIDINIKPADKKIIYNKVIKSIKNNIDNFKLFIIYKPYPSNQS